MNARARSIPLNETAAGEVLAVDVCDDGGRTLLAAGTSLTAASIASLRQRGVTGVRVERPVGAEELAAQREEQIRRLDHLFRHVREDALMNRLHDAVLAFRLEQLR